MVYVVRSPWKPLLIGKYTILKRPQLRAMRGHSKKRHLHAQLKGSFFNSSEAHSRSQMLLNRMPNHPLQGGDLATVRPYGATSLIELCQVIVGFILLYELLLITRVHGHGIVRLNLFHLEIQ